MPPTGKNPQDVINWLTTLLSALAQKHKGELRISRKLIRKVQDAGLRQVLLEDLQNDDIVLRFGSKHSAIYPVEPECHEAQPVQAKTASPPANPGRQPMSNEELGQLARKLYREKQVAALRKEQSQPRVQTPLT